MAALYPNIYQRARKVTLLTQEEAAERLGISPETMSRRLRRELTAEEKEVVVQAILAVERENTK